MVIIHVNFTYNKWFMTSTVRWPRVDLGCCATETERERERERDRMRRGREGGEGEGEKRVIINPLNAELNPIRHLLALVGAHHIVQFSRVRVK